MKKIGKVLAVLLALLTVCTAAAASVFATSGADLITPNPAGDSLAGAEMVDCDMSEYGIRITVPKMTNFVTANSASNEGLDTLQANASDIMEENFLLYDIAADQSSAVYIQYRVTPYTKGVGSFNKLNAQEMAEELEAFNYKYANNNNFGTLDFAVNEKMGGSTVLHAAFNDQMTNPNDTVTDVIYTIQNGIAYTIVSRLNGVDTEDGAERHEKVIDSVRFSAPSLGYAFEGNIAKNSYGINVFLLIASIILLILAALLFFFFYRFSAFQKAADSSFNIFGFDMPYPSDHDDKSFSDEDGDGFDDAHDFN